MPWQACAGIFVANVPVLCTNGIHVMRGTDLLDELQHGQMKSGLLTVCMVKLHWTGSLNQSPICNLLTPFAPLFWRAPFYLHGDG